MILWTLPRRRAFHQGIPSDNPLPACLTDLLSVPIYGMSGALVSSKNNGQIHRLATRRLHLFTKMTLGFTSDMSNAEATHSCLCISVDPVFEHGKKRSGKHKLFHRFFTFFCVDFILYLKFNLFNLTFCVPLGEHKSYAKIQHFPELCIVRTRQKIKFNNYLGKI